LHACLPHLRRDSHFARVGLAAESAADMCRCLLPLLGVGVSSPSARYGRLPRVSSRATGRVLSEVSAFAGFLEHDPEGAERLVKEDLEWLEENNPYLAAAVRASVDSALDLFADRLSHADWVRLELLLLKGALLVLQLLNEAVGESL